MSLLPQHHQQLILDRPPPYAPDQDDLKLPSVPSSETLARMSNDLPHLPALEPTPSINSTYSYPDVPRHPDYKNRNSRSRQSWSSTSSLPLKFPQPPSHAPGEAYSLSETASAMSIEDGLTRKDTNTSFDDADDRMAAEALCGLGKFGTVVPMVAMEHQLTLYWQAQTPANNRILQVEELPRMVIKHPEVLQIPIRNRCCL